MAGKTIPTPGELLSTEIHKRARDAGVHLDVYDPDFIVGVIMSFLGDHDAVLTANGIFKEEDYVGR